jgi:PucR family transcriptional regulator, purine catabolism regulatory protein
VTGISVRALCGIDELAEATVVGGRAGLDRDVQSVSVISTLAAAESVPRGSFVIVAPEAVDGVVIDMLMRAARAAGAVAFLVPESAWVVSSTSRLADKTGMPLLVTTVADPLQLAQQLDRVIHAPELGRAEVLNHLVRKLNRDSVTPESVLSALAGVLSARTALLGADGAVVAGEDLPLPRLAFGGPRGSWDGALRVSGGAGRELVVVPVTVGGDTQPALWLVVDFPSGPRTHTQSAEDAALLASWALAAWVAERRLEGERNARERTQLLSAMLDRPGRIDRNLAQRVLRAGWRLDGWHTGIYLRTSESSGASLVRYTEFLHTALTEHGVHGPLVERATGWVLWLTEPGEPPATTYRQTVRRLDTAIASLPEELSLVVGVGRPYQGPEGIALTLQEAYQASLLAAAGSPETKVAHIDELGLQRLLADWYTSESFQAYARKLLEPLVSSNGEVLLRTVEIYLEHESSTSTTAAALGVHRNTVADRIARAERLLGVNLSASDDRLVVQLACRTQRLGTVEGGDDGVDGGATTSADPAVAAGESVGAGAPEGRRADDSETDRARTSTPQ